MKYEILELNKYNGQNTKIITKTISEAKKKCDFLNNDVWIRKSIKNYKFHWRKLKNKSQEFYKTEKAKKFQNKWLTELFNNEIEIPF